MFGFIKQRLFKKRLPLDESFRLFKEILASNNKALEIITDIGEKLGGEYLFDIVFVREASAVLREALQNSIRIFGTLTQGAYPSLIDASDRIGSQITSQLEDAPSQTRLVVFHDSITAGQAQEVGGKNLHLSEVKNVPGLNVPDGFAITTNAFNEFMRHNGLEIEAGKLFSEEHTEERLEGLRQRVLSAELPPALLQAIEEALGRLGAKSANNYFAVRSSAEDEDGDLSFAGQFESVLNVPADTASVADAYRRVLASLYTEKAFEYQKLAGIKPGSIRMAACCILMVDSVSSGVVYTADPGGPRDRMLISASWGLGSIIVEGGVESDRYVVKKPASGETYIELPDRFLGSKELTAVRIEGGGVGVIPTPEGKKASPCLSDGQVKELGLAALEVERFFGSPQDIEWSLGSDGKIYILQSRPLNIKAEGPAIIAPQPARMATLLKDRGVVVQRGAASGKVFKVRNDNDVARVPAGAILVAKTDSSLFVRAIPLITAIITDTGSQTSHMASVCREFKVPTVVNAAIAMETLEEGRTVTLYAGDDGTAVYDGAQAYLVKKAEADVFGMEKVYEYRRKRSILRHISPLNLVDPTQDNFSPEGCRTVHDLLRFIHEKSVAELVESAKSAGSAIKGHGAVKLDLPIPAGILLIDIGGGLKPHEDKNLVTLEEVRSLPFLAIARGMLHPGAWHSEAVPLNAGDFLSSMVRMSDIAAAAGDYTGYNVAVISGEYVNLSLRFGYHFNMLDCYMSDKPRNNHIYFRFAGGATDITKRSRRIELISIILREYGFGINAKGDLVIGRLSNIDKGVMDGMLDNLGRLVSYTRQLDALLNSDDLVEKYAADFLNGIYELK